MCSNVFKGVQYTLRIILLLRHIPVSSDAIVWRLKLRRCIHCTKNEVFHSSFLGIWSHLLKKSLWKTSFLCSGCSGILTIDFKQVCILNKLRVVCSLNLGKVKFYLLVENLVWRPRMFLQCSCY